MRTTTRLLLCISFVFSFFALSSVAAAQDCDPEENPACYCADSDGFPCDPNVEDDCACEDFSDEDDFPDDEPIATSACDPAFACLEECGEDFSCFDSCTAGLEGEQATAVNALISCVQENCDLDDDSCIESACAESANAALEACYGDDVDGGGDDWDDTPFYCEEFDECSFDCEDEACVAACADTLSGDQRVAFDAAFACIENSSCEDDDCLQSQCEDVVEAFFASCYGLSEEEWDAWEEDSPAPGGGTTDPGDGGTGSGTNTDNSGNSGGGGNLFSNPRRQDDSSNPSTAENSNADNDGAAAGCSVTTPHSSGSAPLGALGLLLLGFAGMGVRRVRRDNNA